MIQTLPLVLLRSCRIMASSLLLIAVLGSRSAHASPSAGWICTLTSDIPMYLSQDARESDISAKSGMNLTLKALSSTRWMVALSTGKLGFVDDALVKERCRLSSPPTPRDDRPKKSDTPALEGADLVDTVTALEVSREAAEGQSVDLERLKAMQSQIEKVSNARKAAREGEAQDVDKAVIRVAVYDLELTNLPAGLGRLVTEALLEEVRKLEGVSAIGMDEVREMLDFERERRILGCESDDECLAEIAGALGVDELLTGQLSEQADGRMMVLKRIDQRRAEVRESFSKRLEISQGEEFLLALGGAMGSLFPERENRPGTKRGVSEKAVLRLHPPPIPTWATYAVGGAALFAGIVGSGFGYAALDNQRAHNTVPTDTTSLESADYRRYADNTMRYQSLANGSFAAAGTFLLSGLVMSLFTDWEGHQEALDEE